ncbi:MAG: hypothetical protein OXG60_01370 [Chloroflexi bacterium]|nr:hypothetical protein [Chloroflexota bacterium]
MSEKPPFHSRKTYRPGLVFRPQAQENIKRGLNTLVSAIRPTLGPTARTVAVTSLIENKDTPEVLDDGGIIARRVIELHRRDADVGAMLARALICRQNERMGDGSATTAVLLAAIYNGGLHYLASGGDAMRLRHHLERALGKSLIALDQQTYTVEGKHKLAQVAESICHDADLAKLLGEIFDIIGAYGRLDIRKDHSRILRREYIEGMAWDSGLFSRDMIVNRAELQTVYEEPAFVLADFKVNDPRHIMPMLEIAVDQKIEKLILVAAELSAEAMAGLMMANGKLKNFQVMAVRGPGSNADDRATAFEDIAIATGAKTLVGAAGDSLKDVTYEHFGWARRGWAGAHNFGIIGGKGDPRKLRQHVSRLQRWLEQSDDPLMREALQKRIGRLMGGSATLWIGGVSEIEIDQVKTLAEKTASAMRAAVSDGVLPGGGMAYMNCRSVLESKSQSGDDPDERAAHRILLDALAEPARAIYENAGYEPGEVIARLSDADNGCGFDVLSGAITDGRELVDSAAVMKAALRNAVLTAGMMLTIDVIAHHQTPEIARQPG